MKFLQSLDPKIFNQLQKLAKSRGITVQDLLRAIVVPEWISKVHPEFYINKRSEAMKKGWETRRKNAEAEELRVKNEEFPPYPAGPTQ